MKDRVDPTVLNRALRIFFQDALRVALKKPSQAFSFLRTLRWLARSARLRASWQRKGIRVPPIIIFSITNRCNLACQGCYAQSLHPNPEDELDPKKLREITEEAKALGVSFFVLTGGEPLLRTEMMDIMRDFPEVVFIVFTNGLLIDEDTIGRFQKQRNVVPLLSLEGSPQDTDRRRGEGTHAFVLQTMEKMDRRSIFFGTSLTLTRSNYSTLTDRSYIRALVDKGCRFFLFVDYTPTQEGTEAWVLTPAQRQRVPKLMQEFRRTFPALFIAVPWDEIDVGGCLSAGRGFIHINAQGNVEPCPFAPYSDANLKDVSLKEALRSEVLEAIRQVPELSKYTGGGCALWKNQEQVQSLLHKSRTPAQPAL